MDVIQLYQDFSIPFLTEGHKHCRPGWVNTKCPHCIGNEGFHLGYEIETNHYVCWRCGFHGVVPTLSKLINLSERETYLIIKKYGLLIPKVSKEPIIRIRTKAHKLPSNAGSMLTNHRMYLRNRGFDPEYLEREWGLLGTGPLSKLDDIDYKHRIIIPFVWDGQQVSFDSRDVTGKDPGRYKACPKDRELIPHKEIIYGKQSEFKEMGILVEGPTDVWRLGTSSFACSGIKFTPQQVRVIAKTFKTVAVCFDDDPQAKVQANKMIAELKFRGVDAFRVDIEGDPGSMKQEDANYLVKQLIK